MLAGKVVLANMRRMDVAARYGGDEFVLLLPHAGDAEATGVAQRIREEFRVSSAALLKRERGVTMSAGVASRCTQKPPHADQLVAMADAALYKAKEAGRDCTSVSAQILNG